MSEPTTAAPKVTQINIKEPFDDVIEHLVNTLHTMTRMAVCMDKYAVTDGIVHLRSFVFPLGEFGMELGIYAIHCGRGLSFTGMFKFGRYGDDFRPTDNPIIGLQMDAFPVRPENNTVLDRKLAWRKDIWPAAESSALLSLMILGAGDLISQKNLVTLAITLVGCQSLLPAQFPPTPPTTTETK